jgi:hypothetical protein
MVGQTTTQLLRHARAAERPVRRSDGRWILKDVCAAACAVALDHALVGLENDPDRNDRFVFVFEHDATFEADFFRFTADQPVRIQTFIDAFFSLKFLLRARSRSRREASK